MPAQFVLPLKPAYYDHYKVGQYLDIAIDDLRGTYLIVGTANGGHVLVIEELEAEEFPVEALKFKVPKNRVNPIPDEQLEALKALHTEHVEQRKLGAIDDDITDGIIDILDGLFGVTQDEATAIDEAKGG